MPDLLREFAGYAARTTRATDRRLVQLGVPLRWLHSGPARYGVAAADLGADGYWQPADAGPLVAVVPSEPLAEIDSPDWPTEAVADLIAFRPADPARWWCRTGATALLNPDAVARAAYFDEPIHVRATPLAWLAAEGTGVSVLDWTCFLPWHLAGCRIVADDLPLAERLDAALNRPPPGFSISVRRGVAAA